MTKNQPQRHGDTEKISKGFLCGAVALWRNVAAIVLCAIVFAALLTHATAQSRPMTTKRQMIVLFDGLRPDYVTPEIMPTLYALGQRGVVFTNHHSVFPTVTRVNTSSISTGAYPEVHGLIGNTVFFPELDKTRFLDTANRENLLNIDRVTNGSLLTAPTLGETLQAAGKKLLVVSAGSTGSSFLLNHKVSGGAILHMDYALPASLDADVQRAVGPLAPKSPSDVLNRRMVDLFLKVGLPKVNPDVAIVWFTDPDTTAHEKGIGSPETIDCLKKADAEFQRLLDGLRAAGLGDQFDIWVTSDHGFTTHTGGASMQEVLKPFMRAMPDGSPRIVTGGDGAIYVRDHDRADIGRIVAAMQKTRGVGAIFTAPVSKGSRDGWAPGTLSFDVIRWQHARSADIMSSPDWTDNENQYHVRGTVTTGGVAGHGSTSPFDIHNTLIAAGPDLRSHVSSGAPSGNVDFAPTVLTLLGIAVPKTMEGRPLLEALSAGPDPKTLAVSSDSHTAKTGDGSYAVTASFSAVQTASGRYWYFDSTRVVRKAE